MGFFSFLKYNFIIFPAHLATSCGALFENHWSRVMNDPLENMRWSCQSLRHCFVNFMRVK
jgi:hypothetical protein